MSGTIAGEGTLEQIPIDSQVVRLVRSLVHRRMVIAFCIGLLGTLVVLIGIPIRSFLRIESSPRSEEWVTVLSPTRAIRAGAPLLMGDFEELYLPTALVPKGMVRDQMDISGRFARTTMLPGFPVVRSQLATSSNDLALLAQSPARMEIIDLEPVTIERVDGEVVREGDSGVLVLHSALPAGLRRELVVRTAKIITVRDGGAAVPLRMRVEIAADQLQRVEARIGRGTWVFVKNRVSQ